MTPNTDHPATPQHLSVAAAIDLLGETLALTVGPVALVGTLRGLRRGRSWSRAELITFDSTTVAARLPVAIPPSAYLESDAADDAQVVATGNFEVHRLYGPVQFVADHIAVIDAVADPVIETRRFLAELESLDLLEANKSLVLVEQPHRIGLIAPTGGGAGGNDFRSRLDSTPEDFQLVHRHVPMAGPDASTAIAAAMRELPAAALDTIVICRGGGAPSELAVFDHPLVIAAICSSPIPVIVGVGHSTDTTRADEVAHTSVPTPTAAAAWLIDRRVALRHRELVQHATIRSMAATSATAAAEHAEERATDAERTANRRQQFATVSIIVAMAVIVIAIAVALAA